MKAKKRFIAGAVCPRCAEIDRLVIYREADRQYRECVNCGFTDEMRFQSVNRELETRVNRTPEERRQEVKVVKLVDPRAPSGNPRNGDEPSE